MFRSTSTGGFACNLMQSKVLFDTPQWRTRQTAALGSVGNRLRTLQELEQDGCLPQAASWTPRTVGGRHLEPLPGEDGAHLAPAAAAPTWVVRRRSPVVAVDRFQEE